MDATAALIIAALVSGIVTIIGAWTNSQITLMHERKRINHRLDEIAEQIAQHPATPRLVPTEAPESTAASPDR